MADLLVKGRFEWDMVHNCLGWLSLDLARLGHVGFGLAFR